MSAAQTDDEVVVQTVTSLPSRASSFEIRCEFVELVDPAGHKHWLTEGQDVPDWISNDRLAELIAAGDVFEFRRI